jgi:signal transduction histidine kinase
MKNHFLKITFLFLFGVLTITGMAQVKLSSLIGAYAYNFAKYTTWPQEAIQDSFRLLLISSDPEIVGEFKTFAQTKKVKSKPIALYISSSAPQKISSKIHMIFLSDEEQNHFSEVYKKIENRPILFVSENSKDKRNVMINLYYSPKQELLFEVNKATIINHNLRIDPEILLMGGTEIDVAELYRNSQQELESLQNKMNLLNDSLLSLNSKISATLYQLEIKQRNIKENEKLLESVNSNLEKGKQELSSYRNEIESQKEKLTNQEESLNKQKQTLDGQIVEIAEQQAYNASQQKEIKQNKKTLDSLQHEITSKNITLGQQQQTIKQQKRVVILSFVAGGLFLIILISIVKSYRDKVKKNKLLTEQKNEIEKINKKLETSNKNLYDTITKLKETQMQLVSSEKMASLGVLTAGIAHEINNPVNFIYTGINSLRKDYEEFLSINHKIEQIINDQDNDGLSKSIEEIKQEGEYNDLLEIIPQTIEDIKVGAERASDIIKGLRNFSRIDKDSMQLSDIHDGLNSSLLLLRNKFKNHIAVEKDYHQLPLIECYPGKLNQAFLNILSNSIDAIEDQGKITIRTFMKDDQVVIQIEDTGKGIPDNIKDKIFDPFFTTKSVGNGVGLGLSITFGIVQEHNGKIDVKSSVNSGTIFTISLPCTISNNQLSNDL